MRIISQSLMDFPYDQIIVEVDENRVMCKLCGQSGVKYQLGEYKSNERAVEVFDEINKQFYNIPLMEDGDALYNQTTFIMPEE